MTSCLPNISCAPFDNPGNDEESSLRIMIERVNAERERPLKPSEWECNSLHLRRFYRQCAGEIEPAMNSWTEWVQWRHDVKADETTAEDIQWETNAGLASWRGKDKTGRPCLVVTGRMMDLESRQGNYKTFQKFLIKIVEDGIKLADEVGVDEVCILYDRRELQFSNIDTVLHQFSRGTIDSLKKWYGRRIGALYVLHMNWFYWLLYSVVISPFLSLTSSRRVFIAVESTEDLLEYFHEEELFLLSLSHDDEPAN